MSFILDALKKSETDRQQQSTAEFASVPTSPAPTGVPRWLWVVGLLLAINIVILVGVLLRPEAETPAAVEVETRLAAPRRIFKISKVQRMSRQALRRRSRPLDKIDQGNKRILARQCPVACQGPPGPAAVCPAALRRNR